MSTKAHTETYSEPKACVECGEYHGPGECTAITEPQETAPPAHPEDTCQRCGRPNVTWFAPSPVWNRVMRGPDRLEDRHGIICPVCFVQLAEAAGDVPTAWIVAPEAATHSPRHDPNSEAAAVVGPEEFLPEWVLDRLGSAEDERDPIVWTQVPGLTEWGWHHHDGAGNAWPVSPEEAFLLDLLETAFSEAQPFDAVHAGCAPVSMLRHVKGKYEKLRDAAVLVDALWDEPDPDTDDAREGLIWIVEDIDESAEISDQRQAATALRALRAALATRPAA